MSTQVPSPPKTAASVCRAAGADASADRADRCRECGARENPKHAGTVRRTHEDHVKAGLSRERGRAYADPTLRGSAQLRDQALLEALTYRREGDRPSQCAAPCVFRRAESAGAADPAATREVPRIFAEPIAREVRLLSTSASTSSFLPALLRRPCEGHAQGMKETASESATMEGYESHFENFDGGHRRLREVLRRRRPAPLYKAYPTTSANANPGATSLGAG